MKPIAILKAGFTDQTLRHEHGDFEDWIIKNSGQDSARFSILNIKNIARWPHPMQFKAIIITGSHANVTEPLPWIAQAETYLRSAREHQIPLLGICFGHQLLARAFGGQVDDNPNGAEFGAVLVHLNEAGQKNPLFAHLPSEFPAFMSHRQTVLRLPQAAIALAFSSRDNHAAFFLEPAVWGVQFHPEFSREIMAHYLVHHFQLPMTDIGLYLQEVKWARQIIPKFLSMSQE